ncbi:hypothetical protein K0M31_006774 [Melipona bicolor]|uniref:Uncharacterized protein n=1 Tax=Melipona bicolor TaxID=60889 RepID=A0AA40FSA1_9HYME|nr:hypothetical protein K0M31_006774 [Melipona bicolor]
MRSSGLGPTARTNKPGTVSTGEQNCRKLLSRTILANEYCSESYCPRASLNYLRVDVSRPARKWTQYYTALGELLSEFEVLRVLPCEQKLFGLTEHSKSQTVMRKISSQK